MKKLEVKIDSSVFVATFLDELAPVTCATIRKHLPFSSKDSKKPYDGMIHSAWSGWALLTLPPWNIRRALPRENETIYGGPGEIAIAGVASSDTWIAEEQGTNHLFICHGHAQYRSYSGPLQCNLFAKISDNLEELSKIGKQLHFHTYAGERNVSLREI
jgi:hypothetical protein